MAACRRLAASASDPATACVYKSAVIAIELWPRRSETVFFSTRALLSSLPLGTEAR